MTEGFAMGVCALAALTLVGAAGKSPESPRIVPKGTDRRLLSAISKANSNFDVAMTKKDMAPIVSGKYAHRLITGGIGHNLPQEARRFSPKLSSTSTVIDRR